MITNKLKCKGFTLAEVLITLGIIGVVASLTIPTLIKHSQDVQLRSAFKKEFASLNAATSAIMSDNGNTMIGLCATDPNPTNCYADTYAKYMKTTKTCYQGSFYGTCWVYTGEDKFLNGDPYPNGQHMNAAGFMLNSGSSVAFRTADPTNCQSPSYNRPNDVCTNALVDVNGLKPPNTVGKDIQFFYVIKQGLAPGGAQDPHTNTDCVNYGFGCAAKILTGEL